MEKQICTETERKIGTSFHSMLMDLEKDFPKHLEKHKKLEKPFKRERDGLRYIVERIA